MTTDEEKIQYLIMGLAYAAQSIDDHVNNNGSDVDSACKSIASLIDTIQREPDVKYWDDRIRANAYDWISKETKRRHEEYGEDWEYSEEVESEYEAVRHA